MSMNPVAERFAENLKRYRKSAGFSQEELASQASLHRTEIDTLERALRILRIDSLLKLCAALEVTPNDLLEGIEWSRRQIELGRFELEGGQSGEVGSDADD